MTRPQHLDLSSKLTHLAFHPRSLPTEKPQTSHVTPARDQTGHGEHLPSTFLDEPDAAPEAHLLRPVFGAAASAEPLRELGATDGTLAGLLRPRGVGGPQLARLGPGI